MKYNFSLLHTAIPYTKEITFPFFVVGFVWKNWKQRETKIKFVLWKKGGDIYSRRAPWELKKISNNPSSKAVKPRRQEISDQQS